MNPIDESLEAILNNYRNAFSQKQFVPESIEEDDLMLAFGITQELKSTNKQYWGRELGACWERLVKKLCELTCEDFRKPHLTSYDLAVSQDAIDTKYRLGSGDAKTLGGLRENGKELIRQNFTPILLIVRTDNLPQAIQSCKSGGWNVKVGNEAFQYLEGITKVNLKDWLKNRRDRFSIDQ